MKKKITVTLDEKIIKCINHTRKKTGENFSACLNSLLSGRADSSQTPMKIYKDFLKEEMEKNEKKP